MPRAKKNKSKLSTLQSQWKSGEYNPLLPGSICKIKDDPENKPLFIIGSQNHEIGTYNAKAWYGPNPWDYSETQIHYSKLEIVDAENPTKYCPSDRYVGPSSNQIKELTKRFVMRDEIMAKTMSIEDKEAALAAMEEEYSKKRIMDDGSRGVESDDDDPTPITIDPVERKRQEIIDEE